MGPRSFKCECVAVLSWIDLNWAYQFNDTETARVLREINYATLRTAVKLFDRLDLQPVDGQQEEPGHNVSSLFIRYSGFLFKLLRRFDSSVRPISPSYLISAHVLPQSQDDGLSEQTSFSQVRTTLNVEALFNFCTDAHWRQRHGSSGVNH